MGRPSVLFSGEIFLPSIMFLLDSIGMVGATMEASICEITRFVEIPKRACTWVGSMKSTNLGFLPNEKVVLLGFYTSGGLRVFEG